MQNMPIAIFRGDDTDALGYQTIVGTIKTDLDLTGCKAVFKYLSFSVEFDPIPEDKKLTVIIPASETSKFPPGLGYASLRVFDSEGRLSTFSNRIMVFVATKTPMFGNEEFEVDFNVRPELEPLKIFVGPNPDDFDEYRGFLEKVIDRASAEKYGLAILLDAIDSDLGANDGVAATPVAVKAAYAAIIKKLTDDYYTKQETDEAIDRVAAYYITSDAVGHPFPTHAALVNAQNYYSGGKVRTPTRNDYAIVLADETQGGSEYRYIYAVAEGQTTGSWQPQYPVEGVMTVDQAVQKDSQNPVSGGGVWSMLWGALWSIPGGFSSVYAWVLNRLGLKRDLTDMACTTDVAGIPQIGSGKFVVTSPSGTSTTLTPFESSGVRGWGSDTIFPYMTFPYISVDSWGSSYYIIFGSGLSDKIPLDMTAKTQTVTYNDETWTVDAFTGATVNTRLANMTDLPSASASTPAMDGTGAAGTSEAFARGDHVHPTDTTRMAASATGADIAVSGSDATKIDAALAGKATKADATLVNASDWVCSPAEAEGGTVHIVQDQSGAWYPFNDGGGIGMAKGNAQSLSLSWAADEWYGGVALTATRAALGGYVLGSQTDKPLASEAEAETLRTGVAGKLDKSGGTMTGNLTVHNEDGPWAEIKAETAQNSIAIRQRGNVSTLETDDDTYVIPRSGGTFALTADIPYDRITITTGQLQDHAVQKVTLNAATTTITLPALTDLTDKVSDFGIDMVNAYAPEVGGTPTPTAASFSLAGTIGTDYNLIVPEGEDWSEMSALAAGEMAQFYFTLSAFAINDKPTWKIVKQTVELVPVPLAP